MGGKSVSVSGVAQNRFLAFAMGLVVLFVAAALAASARADDSGLVSAADRSAIQSVISGQVDAFRADDGATAFDYASPSIRAMFGTPDNFMRMVRQGYRPVYRPRVFEFQEIVEIQGVPAQRVFVVGPDGVPRIAVYLMELQGDGSWRIDGCLLIDAASAAMSSVIRVS